MMIDLILRLALSLSFRILNRHLKKLYEIVDSDWEQYPVYLIRYFPIQNMLLIYLDYIAKEVIDHDTP